MIFHVRSSIVMLPWVSGFFLPGIMPSVHLVTVGVILCPSSSEMISKVQFQMGLILWQATR